MEITVSMHVKVPAPRGEAAFEVRSATFKGDYKCVQDHFKKICVEGALLETRGNRLRAAEALGINRNTLYKYMKALNIKIPNMWSDI